MAEKVCANEVAVNDSSSTDVGVAVMGKATHLVTGGLTESMLFHTRKGVETESMRFYVGGVACKVTVATYRRKPDNERVILVFGDVMTTDDGRLPAPGEVGTPHSCVVEYDFDDNTGKMTIL